METCTIPGDFVKVVFNARNRVTSNAGPGTAPEVDVVAATDARRLDKETGAAYAEIEERLPVVVDITPLPCLSCALPGVNMEGVMPGNGVTKVEPTGLTSAPCLGVVGLITGFEGKGAPT